MLPGLFAAGTGYIHTDTAILVNVTFSMSFGLLSTHKQHCAPWKQSTGKTPFENIVSISIFRKEGQWWFCLTASNMFIAFFNSAPCYCLWAADWPFPQWLRLHDRFFDWVFLSKTTTKKKIQECYTSNVYLMKWHKHISKLDV